MAEEIERKFLVAEDGWRQSITASKRLVQGYLSSNAKATVRIRIADDQRAVLTLKGPVEGISRAEFEYDVPLDDARQMLDLARPNVVEKVRHLVPYGGLTWEVDVFGGAHAGLIVAEVELEAVDQAIDMPDWVGQEVSEDDRYANASLARVPGVPPVDPDVA